MSRKNTIHKKGETSEKIVKHKKNLLLNTKFQLIAVSVLFLAGLAYFMGNPSITGYQSYETLVANLGITVSQSQVYTMTTPSDSNLMITSIRLSGKVIGDGVAEVYLDNGLGQRILIYTNKEKTQDSLGSITGMVVKTQDEKAIPVNNIILQEQGSTEEAPSPLSKNEAIRNGRFTNSCVDSCYLKMVINSKTHYKLLFLVDKGTTLRLDKLYYTLEK